MQPIVQFAMSSAVELSVVSLSSKLHVGWKHVSAFFVFLGFIARSTHHAVLAISVSTDKGMLSYVIHKCAPIRVARL